MWFAAYSNFGGIFHALDRHVNAHERDVISQYYNRTLRVFKFHSLYRTLNLRLLKRGFNALIRLCTSHTIGARYLVRKSITTHTDAHTHVHFVATTVTIWNLFQSFFSFAHLVTIITTMSTTLLYSYKQYYTVEATAPVRLVFAWKKNDILWNYFNSTNKNWSGWRNTMMTTWLLSYFYN